MTNKMPPGWEVLFWRWFVLIGGLVLALVGIFSCGQKKHSARFDATPGVETTAIVAHHQGAAEKPPPPSIP